MLRLVGRVCVLVFGLAACGAGGCDCGSSLSQVGALADRYTIGPDHNLTADRFNRAIELCVDADNTAVFNPRLFNRCCLKLGARFNGVLLDNRVKINSPSNMRMNTFFII